MGPHRRLYVHGTGHGTQEPAPAPLPKHMSTYAMANASKSRFQRKLVLMIAWVAENPGLPSGRLCEAFYKSMQSGHRMIRRAIRDGKIVAVHRGNAKLLYPVGYSSPIVCDCTGDCAEHWDLARACFLAGAPKKRIDP